LQKALAKFPADRDLLDQIAAVNAVQSELNARVERARTCETKHLFGEAIREWESIGADYPWFRSVREEVDRLSAARRKEKQEALERWYKQVEDAIDNGDYETAGTMIRQAAQQQPDRKLQSLESKLREGLRKKQESDAKFAEGSRMLSDGDLKPGGAALYQSFSLQPKDHERANAVVLMMLGQIRAHVETDPGSCEGLLAHLNLIRPGLTIPPDIQAAISKKHRPSPKPQKIRVQLEDIANQAEKAKSKIELAAVGRKLQASSLLESSDAEVKRAAGGLLRRINGGRNLPETSKTPIRREPIVAVAALLLLSLAGIVFLLTRPTKHEKVVPVRISVTPDHAIVELNGLSCVTPDCKFSLKPGEYLFKLRKTGYRPKEVAVAVKGSDLTPMNVVATLDPMVATSVRPTLVAAGRGSTAVPSTLAKLEINDATPQTRVQVDGIPVGLVSPQGRFSVTLPPGPHTLDLSLDGFSSRTITRDFARGESISLAKEDVQLSPRRPDVRR
jgi:hypothetical protein